MPGDEYGYISTKVTVSARDALQRATLAAQAAVGRRLNQSAVLLAALFVAQNHLDELTAALTEQGDAQ